MFTVVGIDDVEVRHPEREIVFDGRAVHFSKTEFAVALAILTNPGITLKEAISSIGSPEWTCRQTVSAVRARIRAAGYAIEMGYSMRKVGEAKPSEPLSESERDHYEWRIQKLEEALYGGEIEYFPSLGLSRTESKILSLIYRFDVCKDEKLCAALPSNFGVEAEGRDDNDVLKVHISKIRRKLPQGVLIERHWATGYSLNPEGRAILERLIHNIDVNAFAGIEKHGREGYEQGCRCQTCKDDHHRYERIMALKSA